MQARDEENTKNMGYFTRGFSLRALRYGGHGIMLVRGWTILVALGAENHGCDCLLWYSVPVPGACG